MKMIKFSGVIISISLLNLVVYCWSLSPKDEPKLQDEEWNGNWFPNEPANQHHKAKDNELYDSKHKVKMGVVSECDNGLVNLTMDWDFAPSDYTCFDDKNKYQPRYDVNPILKCDHIPAGYSAMHACMDEKIEYPEIIPTFGTHRPLWPRYGEYNYVPVQRWLHSLEHGAVVLLYHPCVNRQELRMVKNIVKGCLYRHVITPFQQLDPMRPFALVTWGCKIEFSKVDPEIVVSFIRDKALHGPEALSKDGQFSQQFLEPARIVSTQDDDHLCPNF